jgi:hypothetical protein
MIAAQDSVTSVELARVTASSRLHGAARDADTTRKVALPSATIRTPHSRPETWRSQPPLGWVSAGVVDRAGAQRVAKGAE